MARASCIAILLVGIASSPVIGASHPLVKTEEGMIEGINQGGIAIYKGVPFAAPPVADLRWRPPGALSAWRGIRKAEHFAPACAYVPLPKQVGAVPAARALATLHRGIAESPQGQEDCLYLNIWSTGRAHDHLPVMVWIYGGSFAVGATALPLYDGANLARNGVILVSIAYRLGPFGFLAEPLLTKEGGGTSGNYGLLDQVAALKWIRRNIAAFGGDPGRITIFGESSGGFSVGILAESPLAKGLFQRAISQSGGWIAPGSEQSLAVAEKKGRALFKSLGVTTLAQARAASSVAVIKAAGRADAWYFPNVDGHVVPEDQRETYLTRAQNDTPILLGTNSDEGATFPRPMTVSAYVKAVKAQYGVYANKVLAAYRVRSDAQAARTSANLIRDADFAWSTWTWARLQARTGSGPVFLYYFDHRPPFPVRPAFKSLGAIHASELPYVFGNPASPQLPLSGKERTLSKLLMSYWTNFAKFGDPNGPGVPHWPQFTGQSETVMTFNSVAAAGPMPHLEKLRLLDGYYTWRRKQPRGR